MKNKLFWTGMVGLLLAIVLMGCDEGTEPESIKVEAKNTTSADTNIIVAFKAVASGFSYALFAKQEGKNTIESGISSFRNDVVYPVAGGSPTANDDADAYNVLVIKTELTIQKTGTKYLFGVLAYPENTNPEAADKAGIVWSAPVTLE